jgi:hypothetical protein
MSTNNSFGFGSKPRMKEVQPGTEARLSFRGNPEVVETEHGDKFEFPITLISHDSHPLLEDGPMDMVWQTKCSAGSELFQVLKDKKSKYHEKIVKAYKNNEWQLTRFDTGAYFISVEGLML